MEPTKTDPTIENDVLHLGHGSTLSPKKSPRPWRTTSATIAATSPNRPRPRPAAARRANKENNGIGNRAGPKDRGPNP